jgi:hypothetical protein
LLIILAFVIAAMLAAGCGGSTRTKAVTGSEATATSAMTASAPAPPAEPDCEATGMSSKKGEEGSCTADGATITIVGPRHEARLRTLGVTLNGCLQAANVSDGSGHSASAHGTFARCSLTVRNRTDAPRTFDGAGRRQTMLVIDGRQFFERSDAERPADTRSFLARDSDIQPGESRTSDVVFDLAPRFIHGLRSSGNLFVFNFGDDGNNTDAAAMLHTYR